VVLFVVWHRYVVVIHQLSIRVAFAAQRQNLVAAKRIVRFEHFSRGVARTPAYVQVYV
jgi:hypothetical protein